jgi:hypothetical protein
MSESPYAIPLDDLVGQVRVAADQQVEVHAEPQQPRSDWRPGPALYGDAVGPDTDGN